MRPPLLVAAVLAAAGLPAQGAPDPVIPVPDDANFAAWSDHILPVADELRWQEIPWRPTFGGGLRDAAADGRPLLFWAMNGHPLGCT